MAETLTDSGSVKLAAGADASTTIIDNPTYMTTIITEAEGVIMGEAKEDFVTNFASYSAAKRQIMTTATTCLAACEVIAYDMTSYPTLADAQTKLDVNWAKYEKSMKQLKEDDNKKFIIRN